MYSRWLTQGRSWLGFGLGLMFIIALFALRLLPAGQESFAFDEAHHAGWARLIANGDPFMRTIAADKPPQLFYFVALSFKLFGENETAARLPNALLGALSVLPLWGLARRLYPAQAVLPVLAVGLFALSPLAQVYAPTVFTDPVIAFWILVSGWLVASGRWGWAGLALGLAICGKQQALFFLPFPVFLGFATVLAAGKFDRQSILGLLKRLAWAVGGTLVPILLLLGFDKWRGQVSSLTYGATLNGEKLTLASPVQWPGRLADWWNRALQYFFVPGPLGFVLLLGLAIFLGWTGLRLWDIWRNRHNNYAPPPEPAALKTVLADTALFAAGGVVLVWHTVMTFPVWDRYLLPMVPFMALLVARMLIQIAAIIGPKAGNRKLLVSNAQSSVLSPQSLILAGLALLTLGLMVRPVAQAANYELPLGGDYLAFGGQGPGAHHAYDGIQDVALFFHNNARPGAVVFHEEMDWHFSYYLFGQPLEIPSNKSRPLDPALVADRAGRSETYVVFSDWQHASYERLQTALPSYGFWLEPSLEVYPKSDEERLAWVVYRVARK